MIQLNMRIKALFILFFISVTLFGQGTTAGQNQKTTLLAVGDEVPAFKFELEKGKSISIKDYKGKMVLINFFATWCAPCRKELPLIQEQIWKKYAQHSKFAMLTFGREHNWKEVDQFKSDQHFLFPILPDPTRKVYALFATQTIPRSVLIGEDGKILYLSEGFEEKQFNELKKILENKL